MLVGSQVVNPQLFGPRCFAGGLFVEEQHIRLHPLCVEKPRGQAQQGVYVALVQQFAADGLARPALEEHVVGHHHGRAAIYRE